MREVTILLIDDDRGVHTSLDDHLRDRGHRVLHATVPQEGIRLAVREHPDVILLDLNMPRMDGLKVCRHLKETATTRDIPVLFLTVDRNVHHLARALECGGADYIVKPFNPVELHARLRAALRNKRLIGLLKEQAWIDALTGLKNRAAMEDALAAAASAFERTGQPMALLVLDLDGFKAVNDTFGHGVGDDVLRAVGSCIRAQCRPYDTPCRLGGDEFVILLGQTDGQDAAHVARRIASAISELRVPVGADAVRVACSGGLACTAELTHAFEPSDMLKAADAALYRAKSAGGGVALAE